MKKASTTYIPPARYPRPTDRRSTAHGMAFIRLTRVPLGLHGEAHQWCDHFVEQLRRLGTTGALDPLGDDLRAQDLSDRRLQLRRERLVLHTLLDVLVQPFLVPDV